MTKFYVFNHQNPSDSFYANPNKLSVYFLGRRLSNYSILLCDKHGKPMGIISGDSLPCEVHEIEKLVEKFKFSY